MQKKPGISLKSEKSSRMQLMPPMKLQHVLPVHQILLTLGLRTTLRVASRIKTTTKGKTVGYERSSTRHSELFERLKIFSFQAVTHTMGLYRNNKLVFEVEY